GGGIRTHGPLARTSVFKTDPFNHSGTPPGRESPDRTVRRGGPPAGRGGLPEEAAQQPPGTPPRDPTADASVSAAFLDCVDVTHDLRDEVEPAARIHARILRRLSGCNVRLLDSLEPLFNALEGCQQLSRLRSLT